MKINLIAFRTSLTEGGIQNTGYLLAKEFNKILGDRFQLLTDNVSNVPDHVQCTKMKYERKWDVKFYLNILKYLKKVRKANINLCMHWFCGVSAFFYKKLNKVPYAVMVYGNEIMPSKKVSFKSIIWRYAQKLVLNNADIVFACSEYSKRLCLSSCSNKNIEVIHPPIMYTDCRIEKSNPNHVIFSIGRHVERKGFQDVIKAIPLIKEYYPDVQYRIAGDGPFHGELTRLVEQLDLSDTVHFLGRISEEEKKKELENCSLFIMTSHEDKIHREVEGFGICYLEANMYGKWVVAADTGGVSDAVINHITGELLDEPSPEKISDVICRSFSNETFDKRKIVDWAKKHDVSVIAEQYIQKFSTNLHFIEE